MGRPPLPVGTAGAISVTEVGSKRFRARCRFRDQAGRVHHIERTGASRTAARNALAAEISARRGLRVDTLKPHHKVATAIALYREQLARRVLVRELAATSADRYREALVYIEPRLGELRLSEVTVGAIESAFGQLADAGLSPNSRRVIREVATQVFELALRHGAIASNPVRHMPRIVERRRPEPKALTAVARRKLFAWLDKDESEAARLARKRDVPDIVRFMIGTGVRLGEMLAVTWEDLELDGTVFELPDGSTILLPTVRITGNIVRVKGGGLQKHEGKTVQSIRTIPLPRFVVAMLKARRPEVHEPTEPVFSSVKASGPALGWREPRVVMRHISEVREAVGMPWLTTHAFRKTAATILHEAGVSDRTIGDHIGHTDRSTLMNVYLGTADVNPLLVHALDAAVIDS